MAKEKLEKYETRLKDGRYEYRYTDVLTGKRKKIHGNTLSEMRTKRQEVEDRQAKYRKLDPNAGRITLNEYRERYYERSGKNHNCSAKNLNAERDMYNCNVRDVIGSLDIRDIEAADIDKIYYRMKERGLKLNSIKRMKAQLVPLFRYAFEKDRIIDVNPHLGVEFFILNRPKNEIKPKNDKLNKSLSNDQQARLIAFCRESPWRQDMIPALIVGMNCGLRFGEIGGLTWKNIDFRKKEIYINQQIQYINADGDGMKIHVCPPKTKKSTRVLPLFVAVEEAIHEIEKLGFKPAPGYEDFIFVNRNGQPQYASNFNARLKHLVDSYNKKHPSEEPLPHLGSHVMRHTAAKNMYAAGIPFEVAAGFFGHEDIELLRNVYYDNTQDEISNAIALMERHRQDLRLSQKILK